jgi:membrane-bound serine protease (ClpP class)
MIGSGVSHMLARPPRRLAGYLALGLSLGLGTVHTEPAPTSPGAQPIAYAAEVDSIIHPVSAEYMIDTMEVADRSGATLVVFILRTPGVLVDSTRAIISHMLAAKNPGSFRSRAGRSTV